MEANYKGFWNFIHFLNQHDFLDHVVVIGSWAEFLYQQTGLLNGYKANIRTLDVDFLIKNKNQPREKMNLPKAAKEYGFIVRQDVLTESSKIYMTEDSLEVEFLIDQKGSGIEHTIKTNIGVNAQPLRYMNILSENTVRVTVLDNNITVPAPEAYALHKMVINKDRKEKIDKDKMGISNLYEFLDKSKFVSLYNGLSPKIRKRVDDYMKKEMKVNILDLNSEALERKI